MAAKLIFTFMAGLLLASFHSASAADKVIAVIGAGECSDCVSKNINAAAAFNGLNVAIYCQVGKGMFQIRGVSKLDEEGKFSVKLSGDVVKDNGALKTKCYAQLHGGPKNAPCPAAKGSLDAAKIVFHSADEGQHTFATAGKLSFSSDTCTSAFFWWYKPIPKFPWYNCPPKYEAPKYDTPTYSPPSYKPPTYSPPSYSSPPY